MTTVGAMSRPARRHGRRLTALVLVLLVGVTSLVVAPSAPAAPAAPAAVQTAPSGEQPTIEAARLDLDAVPADSAATARPDQVHGAEPEPDGADTPPDETPPTEAPV